MGGTTRQLSIAWAIISGTWFVIGFVVCWYTGFNRMACVMLGMQAAYMVPAIYLIAVNRDTANVDKLTSLYTRHYLTPVLEHLQHVAARGDRQFCVVMVDVDLFHDFNGRYTHAGGDLALQQVGDTIKRCCRPSDEPGRWGGEEFVVVVEGSIEDARRVAERIRKLIEEAKIQLGKGKTAQLTVTCGVACSTKDEPEYKNVIKLASAAVIEGKKKGRNRVEVANGVQTAA